MPPSSEFAVVGTHPFRRSVAEQVQQSVVGDADPEGLPGGRRDGPPGTVRSRRASTAAPASAGHRPGQPLNLLCERHRRALATQTLEPAHGQLDDYRAASHGRLAEPHERTGRAPATTANCIRGISPETADTPGEA